MRMQFPREFYIPKTGTTKIMQKDGLAVAYIYTNPRGREAAIAFVGKALKPTWHYTFLKPGDREKRIAELFAGVKAHAERVATRRKESNNGHSFIVGDIVTNSWGYEQTNVDWYRVVRVSRVYVWLQSIAGHTKSGGEGSSDMSGYSVPYADTSSPDPSKWTTVDRDSPPHKHKAEGGNVSMKFGSGRKWNGKPQYESWYA